MHPHTNTHTFSTHMLFKAILHTHVRKHTQVRTQSHAPALHYTHTYGITLTCAHNLTRTQARARAHTHTHRLKKMAKVTGEHGEGWEESHHVITRRDHYTTKTASLHERECVFMVTLSQGRPGERPAFIVTSKTEIHGDGLYADDAHAA